MATATLEATAQLRDGVAALDSYAQRDLAALWAQVQTSAEAGEALHDILPALIATYGIAASALASDWYEDLRDKVGVTGRFVTLPADFADVGAHALVAWAGNTATDLTGFRQLVQGGTQRRIANFARQTVMDTSVRDPKAAGWQRVGVGDSCPFCTMLNSRGFVYSSATATFGAHDNDDCVAVPAFGGLATPVDAYKPTDRRITDRDRARVRAWLRDNPQS